MSSSSIARFRRIRSNSEPLASIYLDVELQFAADLLSIIESKTIEQNDFRFAILHSIDTIFGEAAYRIQFDILKYCGTLPRPRAYIRVLARDYVRFRLALSLISRWNNHNNKSLQSKAKNVDDGEELQCHFVINKACHSAASLPILFNIENHIELSAEEEEEEEEEDEAHHHQ